MKSLLRLSFEQSDISLSTLKTKYNHPVYHDIYDKIVEEVQEDIKRTMICHRLKLILRTIYLLRTSGTITMLSEICGISEIDNRWNVSLWRLAMVYSVLTIDRFKTVEERIRDIVENIEIVLPANDPCIPKIHKHIETIRESDDPDDLNLYIDTYMSFGSKLINK